jgi:dihydroxyacetone kinase-like predicted kinase
LRRAIVAEYDGLEIEVHQGGQPHYRYVIAVE